MTIVFHTQIFASETRLVLRSPLLGLCENEHMCMKNDFEHHVLIEFSIRYGCTMGSAGARHPINRRRHYSYNNLMLLIF